MQVRVRHDARAVDPAFRGKIVYVYAVMNLADGCRVDVSLPNSTQGSLLPGEYDLFRL